MIVMIFVTQNNFQNGPGISDCPFGFYGSGQKNRHHQWRAAQGKKCESASVSWAVVVVTASLTVGRFCVVLIFAQVQGLALKTNNAPRFCTWGCVPWGSTSNTTLPEHKTGTSAQLCPLAGADFGTLWSSIQLGLKFTLSDSQYVRLVDVSEQIEIHGGSCWDFI